MKILGLDTSTDTGGASLIDGKGLVAEYTLSLQRTTHSERLVPAIRRVLQDAGWLHSSTPSTSSTSAAELAQDATPDADAAGRSPVDGLAVALGPGSFTGLRIGVVTAKTLAYAWSVPVVGVSTLEALAYQAAGGAELVCPVMDARNGNVFGAVYDTRGIVPVPVIPPALRSGAEWWPSLYDWLTNGRGDGGDAQEPIVFTGDGVGMHWGDIQTHLRQKAERVRPTLEQLRSSAVAALGRERLLRDEQDDPMQLVPLYLRRSEAERKWEQRQNNPSHS